MVLLGGGEGEGHRFSHQAPRGYAARFRCLLARSAPTKRSATQAKLEQFGGAQLGYDLS